MLRHQRFYQRFAGHCPSDMFRVVCVCVLPQVCVSECLRALPSSRSCCACTPLTTCTDCSCSAVARCHPAPSRLTPTLTSTRCIAQRWQQAVQQRWQCGCGRARVLVVQPSSGPQGIMQRATQVCGAAVLDRWAVPAATCAAVCKCNGISSSSPACLGHLLRAHACPISKVRIFILHAELSWRCAKD